MIHDEDPRTRAIIVVARFADGSRRVRACSTVEEARAFVAGEGEYSTHRMPVGQGREESRTECWYATTDELIAALKKAIA